MALFQSKKIQQLQQQVKALQSLNNQKLTAEINAAFMQRFDTVNYYPDWDTATITNKYATSDQVYAVINKIAETSSLIPQYVYINTDKKALTKLKTLTSRQFYSTKGVFDIILQQVKALEDAPENDLLYKLLESPNAYQSKTEFLTAAYIYYLLNGECFIYLNRIEDGNNKGKVGEMHILPPANVTIHITKDYPQTVTGYDFVVNGQKLLGNIRPEDIIHWKRFNPCISLNGTHLRGLSPLRPGSMPVNRLEEADNRSMNQLKNGAVPGIVYDKSFNGDELEQTTFDNQKKKFYDFISNPSNQGAPFFVGSEKGYLPIGLSAADLKLIELQNIDFKRLCNIYKVSTILFNSDASSTESNVKEMIKQMYTSACLPMVYSLRDKMNAALSPAFSDKPRYINADISGITELQEDIKKMVETIAAMPVTLSGNEQRALLNYDAIDEDWMNKPLIKSGYAFYDDINIEPVDPNLLNV